MTKRSRRRNVSRGADLESQAQDEDAGQRGAHEMSTRTSGRNVEDSRASGSIVPAVQADDEGRVDSSTRSQSQAQIDSRRPGAGDRSSGTSEMPPMIGDFDDNANAFWSLHMKEMKEAKSHDEARIESIKDDMDGVLIFAGLFSAALVSFITDKLHDLQVDPAQQMVYYQNQTNFLLAQISTQVHSIAPQVSIPSTPPQPFPTFHPTWSDVRVNAFWFMSLVFSLAAALLATLVQQWVREYMHVFQRYSNPLKSARLRQYLYEGVEGWYMPLVAESVPGLVHVSLFLFFVGICDSLLSINTTVAISTIVPISICGLLYVLSTFAPIIYPKSPYQNPFSGTIWRLKQMKFARRCSDRASGDFKNMCSDMSKRKVQLAMKENEERKDRDVQAIQWLIDNSTEDDEMESFAMAIPGTFTSEWGVEVWRKVSEEMRHEDANSGSSDPVIDADADSGPNDLTDADSRVSLLPPQGSPLPHPLHTFHPPSLRGTLREPSNLPIADLCKRVRHLLDTCNNRSLFARPELWRKRARGCVETVHQYSVNLLLGTCTGLYRLVQAKKSQRMKSQKARSNF